MMITVIRRCPFCGTISHVTCDEKAYDIYATTRTPIQEIFPDMDLHTRELLISGMCFNCQASFFEDDDDDSECDGDCEECEAWAECPDRHES